MPESVAQSVTCLATDACLTADPEVASSSIDPGPVPYFVEIDHEIASYMSKRAKFMRKMISLERFPHFYVMQITQG